MQSRLMTCQLRLENRESQLVDRDAEDPYQAIALQRHLANLRCEIEWLKKQILREQSKTIFNNL
jgi:hypothetical protein